MWRDFEEKRINEAPVRPGAYQLCRNARVIYVGWAAGAATLRSELLRHLHGDFGHHTQSATEFEYRETDNTRAAYQAYMELFVASGLRPR